MTLTNFLGEFTIQGYSTIVILIICMIIHLIFLLSKNTQNNIVYYCSILAFFIIAIIFVGNIFFISKFHTININDLFNFSSSKFLQCIMFLIAGFRGNKEIMDICRSYSKDEKVMRRLNLYNSLIFIVFGILFSFFYYMEYLPGSRSDYNTQNVLDIYKNAPGYFKWMLIVYILCLMQMLNDNIQLTIHFLDNLFSTKMLESKLITFLLALFFALFNNLIILGNQYLIVLIGVYLLYPNVFVGIPFLVNLYILPSQSLGRILSMSSLVAIFFFFSLYTTINFLNEI